MSAAARATTPQAADEALAYLRRERARQVNAGMGVQLTDGRILFGGEDRAGDFPSVEPAPEPTP